MVLAVFVTPAHFHRSAPGATTGHSATTAPPAEKRREPSFLSVSAMDVPPCSWLSHGVIALQDVR
jgi:hypothetical protein